MVPGEIPGQSSLLPRMVGGAGRTKQVHHQWGDTWDSASQVEWPRSLIGDRFDSCPPLAVRALTVTVNLMHTVTRFDSVVAVTT